MHVLKFPNLKVEYEDDDRGCFYDIVINEGRTIKDKFATSFSDMERVARSYEKKYSARTGITEIKGLTVAELISFLQEQPQDSLVVYGTHAGYVLLEMKEIETLEMCEPTSEGWVTDSSSNMPTRKYLVFPGN